MNIILSKRAVKALSAIPEPLRVRIKEGMKNNIPKGDIKRLRGHNELYRLRVGDWRIVFSYPDKETALIEKISPRGEVYKGV
jgi:mRNA interferase RelE/StbE